MPILRPIHADSRPVPDSEFNVIKDVPVSCVDITQIRERDVAPQSISDNASAAIEFRFDTAADEWVRWKDTLFHFKLNLELTRTGNNAAAITETDWNNIIPAQNLMHSMFKTVDLNVNQRDLCVAPQTYAYQAYLTNLLTTTQNCKDTLLREAGYYSDATARKLYLVPSGTDKTKSEVEFADALHVCFAEQTKSFVGGCRFVLRLIPHSPDFYFRINGAYKLSVKISEPTLKLRLAGNKSTAYQSLSSGTCQA